MFVLELMISLVVDCELEPHESRLSVMCENESLSQRQTDHPPQSLCFITIIHALKPHTLTSIAASSELKKSQKS